MSCCGAYVAYWPIAETAAIGRRVRLLGYCCHQRDMRRRDLRMVRCRYHETKRLSDPPDDAWQHAPAWGAIARRRCWICHHEAIISVEPWPDSVPCPRSGRAWCARVAELS